MLCVIQKMQQSKGNFLTNMFFCFFHSPHVPLYHKHHLFSVPCVPANLQGFVECSTNKLEATWDAAAGAAYYISTLKGAGGFSSFCATDEQSCIFSVQLQCAQMYMLSVVAVNDRCNSSESAVISAITGM